MKNWIFKIILALGVIGGLIYGMFYLWGHRYEYFFQGEEIETIDNVGKDEVEKDVLDDEGGADDDSEEDSEEDSEDIEDDDEDEDDDLKDDVEDYTVPIISKSDCENECKNRQGIEYKYCREICGFNGTNDEDSKDSDTEDDIISDECDDIDDSFEEDVCWKKKAIKEKNAKYCDEIYSEALSKVCQDRVLEEIMK
jgi:hypothetical protein